MRLTQYDEKTNRIILYSFKFIFVLYEYYLYFHIIQLSSFLYIHFNSKYFLCVYVSFRLFNRTLEPIFYFWGLFCLRSDLHLLVSKFGGKYQNVQAILQVSCSFHEQSGCQRQFCISLALAVLGMGYHVLGINWQRCG